MRLDGEERLSELRKALTHLHDPLYLEKLEIVAQNKIGEPSNSTPAFINGAIIFRSMKYLYCIGKPIQVAAK